MGARETSRTRDGRVLYTFDDRTNQETTQQDGTHRPVATVAVEPPVRPLIRDLGEPIIAGIGIAAAALVLMGLATGNLPSFPHQTVHAIGNAINPKPLIDHVMSAIGHFIPILSALWIILVHVFLAILAILMSPFSTGAACLLYLIHRLTSAKRQG